MFSNKVESDTFYIQRSSISVSQQTDEAMVKLILQTVTPIILFQIFAFVECTTYCQNEIPGSAGLCDYRSHEQIVKTFKEYAAKYPWAYYGSIGKSVEGTFSL